MIIEARKLPEKPTFESELVEKAYKFAKKCHATQLREGGEPYFSHCEGTCQILRDNGVRDENCLAAGLLHDTVEDCKDQGITVDVIRVEFGDEVAELVSDLTKLNSDTDEETLKKIIGKSYINPKVALIKLADRLHNMRTLGAMRPEQQKAKALETLKVYTRLAESLGMWRIKTELEDLSFKYVDPVNYKKTFDSLKDDPRLSPDFIDHLTSRLEQLLADNNIDGRIQTRKGGYWALMKKREKMAREGKSKMDTFEKVNNVISFRVILDKLEDCYQILGKIHNDFGEKVDHKRFHEFIGRNKHVNGYQALQTTLDFPGKGSVEVAIATEEMEEFNNYGIVGLINEGRDLKDYTLKLVFDSEGTAWFLPREAVGADFAALTNQEMLLNAGSVTIDSDDNERSLATVIPNASTVRVNLREPGNDFSLTALKDFCALPLTRDIIAGQEVLIEKEVLMNKGQEKMEEILGPRGLLVLSDVNDKSKINRLLYRLGCQSIDDLYFMLGNGAIKKTKLKRELDSARITKEDLEITSVRIIGPDQLNIFREIIDEINKEGQKNLAGGVHKRVNGNFDIRMLVEKMTPEEEENLRQYLEADPRFTEYIVV